MKLVVDGEARNEADVDIARPATIEKEGLSLSQAFAAAMCKCAYADRPALGWQHAFDGHFEWVSYRNFFAESYALTHAMSAMLPSGAVVGIMGRNCYEWFLADFSCMRAGLTSVPLSGKWGQSVLVPLMQHVGLSAICCEAKLVSQIQEANATLQDNLALVVAFKAPLGHTTDPMAGGARTGSGSTLVTDLQALILQGKAEEGADEEGQTMDQLAAQVVKRDGMNMHTILHTSDTTGLPKCVLYTDSPWLNSTAVTYEGLQVGFSYIPSHSS
jgi:long-subunit acyl-CoA synthetase (AMP-forming)